MAAADLFEAGTLTRLSAFDAAARLGEAAPGALEMSEAIVLEPATLLAAWTGPVAWLRSSPSSRATGVRPC